MLYCLFPNHKQRPQDYNLILLDFSDILCRMAVGDRLGAYTQGFIL